MKWNRVLFVALTYLLLYSTLYAWENNPKSGWDFNYEASCGLRPDQTKPGKNKVIVRGYQFEDKAKPGFVSMVCGKDNEVALRLLNNGTDERFNRVPGKFAHFYLPFSANNKSKAMQSTLDFKFRLDNATIKKAQFSISMISRVAKGNQLLMVWITFARDRIFYLNKNKGAAKKYALGNKWHTGRVHVDLRKKRFSLFIDKKVPAVFSADLSVLKKGTPKLQFGDGSSSVEGSVDLAYIRLSHGELVSTGTSK